MNEYVKGGHSINLDVIKEMTFKKLCEVLKHIPKEILREAHAEAKKLK
jgi:hypothetical protein